MADRSSDMTLAFTLAALERLDDPAAAVENARNWSEHVGAVSSAPNGALSYTRDRRIRLDFFSGTRPPAEALYGAQASYDTERYVLVGVGDQRHLAERGWEFQHVDDAAAKAGWSVRDEPGGDGGNGSLVERLRAVLGR